MKFVPLPTTAIDFARVEAMAWSDEYKATLVHMRSGSFLVVKQPLEIVLAAWQHWALP